MLRKSKPVSLLLSTTALLVLQACGGGSDDAPTPEPPTPPAPPVTLTGSVTVDQGVSNTVVCMDLNANSACDANEPASEKTAASGAYSLTYDPAKITAAEVAATALIAPIAPGAAGDTTTAVDAARPGEAATTTAYVLRQVPGKSGAINPLTTLVAAGVAAGMTEAAARSNVQLQLGVTDAEIDNYQSNPASDPSQIQVSARAMAGVTAAALQAGSTLAVGDQTVAINAAPGSLATFRYGDADNYFVRTLDIVGKPEGAQRTAVQDTRSGKTKGTPTTGSSLYTQAYLSAGSWTYCNAEVAITSSSGNPSLSNYCKAFKQVGFDVYESLAGKSMSSVVTAMQADASTNTINNGDSTDALLAKLGASTFPAGARLQTRVSYGFSQPLFINSVSNDVLNPALTTLEQVVAGVTSSGVTLATGRGTLGLGLTTSNAKALRVAFTGTTSPTAGTVQFYECDLNAAQTAVSNCITTQTGTYSIVTVDGVRALRYAGHAETIMNHTRLHAEVASIDGLPATGPRVFVVRESKVATTLTPTQSKRLDATAWGAMRTALGL